MSAKSARQPHLDAEVLESALRRHLRGEARFDDGSRALYATDGSNYPQVPIGVVLPKDTDDVIAATSICRQHGAPVLCPGGRTPLSAQSCIRAGDRRGEIYAGMRAIRDQYGAVGRQR